MVKGITMYQSHGIVCSSKKGDSEFNVTKNNYEPVKNWEGTEENESFKAVGLMIIFLLLIISLRRVTI